MDPERVIAISEWQALSLVHDVRVFLGFANFYCRFIEGYSCLVTPITNLLKIKDSLKFNWNQRAQAAFDELKSRFVSALILRHYDPDLSIRLHSNASDFALFGILSQLHDDDQCWHPIAYW
jgi:RNase H-like domain found in reverse transcriptase